MKHIILLVFFISLTIPDLKSQNCIEGEIFIDTIWRPVVYLSIIADFDDMNSMSNEMIIEKADINPSGRFILNTEFLPEGDNLCRIHIAKKNDPHASLIIGGKDENHFFLIVNKQFSIRIQNTSQVPIFNDATVLGYTPNDMLHQINGIASFLDSTGFNVSYLKTELIRSAIYNKLRIIADTSTNPLVSLYALYKTDFEKNFTINKQFYKDYLIKWKKENSSYFVEFRKKIPYSNHSGIFLAILAGTVFFFIGILVSMAYVRLTKKKQNLIRELSVQERKIFALIIEGKSNKEISEVLYIGLSTVKSHINSIYSKLDISSRKDILNLNQDEKIYH